MKHIALASFIKQHCREPQLTGDKEEADLARWLTNQRSYFRRVGHVVQEYEDYLASEGFPGILRRNKQESQSNQVTKNILSWILQNGKEPNPDSDDPAESYLGQALDRKRSTSSYYDSDHEIANQAGVPNLYLSNSREEDSNKTAIEFCKWVLSHGGRAPNKRSENETERKLANWFWNRRSMVLGSVAGTIYESDLMIIESFGLIRFFRKLGQEQALQT